MTKRTDTYITFSDICSVSKSARKSDGQNQPARRILRESRVIIQ